MPKVKAGMTISLDGYVAGPNQGEANPLGEGGEALHEWAFKQASFKEMHDLGEGGERGVSDELGRAGAGREFVRPSGADRGGVGGGRSLLGPPRGPGPDEDWKGWWGDGPPF